MSQLNLIWQNVKTVALFWAFWLAMQAEILAAPAKKAAGSDTVGSQAWVAPYALAMMAIGLGMLVVCRSSRRSDRAKPKEYQSVVDAR